MVKSFIKPAIIMEHQKIHANGKKGDTTCPACGATFECTLSMDCWCGSVNLPPEVREYLADRYESCLCRSCLEELIEKADAGKLL